MLVTCKQCGKEFHKTNSQIKRTKNNFCSRSCAASYNNTIKAKRKPKERECSSCGAKFRRKRGSRSTLCQTCKTTRDELDYKTMTLGEYQQKLSVKGKHTSWKNAHVRNFCRSWNKDLQSKACQVCGYTKHVELAHSKPIASFSPDTPLGLINDKSNIFVLCRNCHWEFDNGLLMADNIPPRQD